MQVSELYLSEKEKTLILLALDTHSTLMRENGCSYASVDIFYELYDRIAQYDTTLAAEIIRDVNRVSLEAAQDEPSLEEDAEFIVELMDDDHCVAMYEALCNRLGADPDVDVADYPSDQIDLEELIKSKAADVETDANPNEAYPSDVEPVGIDRFHGVAVDPDYVPEQTKKVTR